MRVATLLRRLPWLAPLLVACVDDTTTGGATDSGTGGTGSSNAVPLAVDDVVFVRQEEHLALDAAAGLLGNDTDPDGDSLTVTDFDAASASGGNVAIAADGAFTYDPPAGFWGPDSFEYTIADDGGATATATATVYVAPVQVPLGDVSGGFAMDGEAESDWSGISVSGAGDVNGDGMDDVIVGALYSGRAYAVLGRPDTTAVQLSSVDASPGGFVIEGAEPAVSDAGDVNGDGMADVIIGVQSAYPNGSGSGQSYIVFGKAETAAVELSSIAEGMGGFVLKGEAAGDLSGCSVSGAGDVNGDGLDDIVVGARLADTIGSYPSSSSGRSYVVFGKVDTTAVQLSAITAGSGGFALYGEAGDESGRSVSGAGDVNGDGFDDIIIGGRSGRSYVVFGKTDTTAVQLRDVIGGVGGFTLGDETVFPGGGAGDVNGDGMSDIIVGGSGRGYVVFGKANTTAVQLSSIAAGMGGFVLEGEADEDVLSAASGAGDVNGDGMGDVIVGVPHASPNVGGEGRTYVVYGKADTTTVQLSAIAAGMGGFVLDGEANGHAAGASVSDAGDVNGDGFDDVMIGAFGADPHGPLSGRSYVVFGVPTGEN